ncbi:MAG: FecR domain-containing protein [Pseudomonadota bacterium]|nr:FecR domain-containing protein [Pseudomonadota bacterium]
MKLQRQIDKLLAQRASEWHQILENADESERAEFVSWLKQSPLHVQEYLETVYTDQVLKHVDAEATEDVDTLIAQMSQTVVPLTGVSAGPVSRGLRPKRWAVGIGCAAAVALCALLLPLVLRHFENAAEYATALGEQRTIQLADSSIVTLNADSRIELSLDRNHRSIELKRGEALFKVAHDPARPFTVQTHTVIVEAVGTQFNVYERQNGTRVSVLEGRVLIRPLGNGGAAAITPTAQSLGAGQEAQVAPDGTIQRNAKADVVKTVAWRERRLIFDDAPIEDVIYEFNRYNQSPRLTLEGIPPGSRHYNGIFDAADPDSLAELLSREPDLVIERRNEQIIIRKR